MSKTTRGDLDPNSACVALVFFERSLTHENFYRWACPLHDTGNWVFGRWQYLPEGEAPSGVMAGLKQHINQVHPRFKREQTDEANTDRPA